MNTYRTTAAQLRLLANLRDGKPAECGFAPGKAAEVESNCMRNGLLRPWPFPGRGRLSDAGRTALESLDETSQEALNLITAGGAFLAVLVLVLSPAMPLLFP